MPEVSFSLVSEASLVEPAAHSPFSLLPPRGSRRSGFAGPAGTADLPSAVPARGGVIGTGFSKLCAPIANLERTKVRFKAALEGCRGRPQSTDAAP